MLEAGEIQLLRECCARAKPVAAHVAELFYCRLFELEPAVRSMFHGDLERQGKKLMDMLAWVVDHLEHEQTLIARVREIGCQHATYGVTADHYASAGSALIYALETALGGAFTAELEDAWIDVYTFLSQEMEQAARQAP